MLEMANILAEKCESQLLYCLLIYELAYKARRLMLSLANANFGAQSY